jgi:hypothetical protein
VNASLRERVVASGGQTRLGSHWPGVAAMRSYETVGSQDVNTEAWESTLLGAVTRQRILKTENLMRAIVKRLDTCRVQ